MIPCQYRHKWYIAKNYSLAYISAAESIGTYIFNHFYVIRPETTEFGEITRPLGLLRRSRWSKVIKFGTNRKLICDFLLVISSTTEGFP